MFLWNHNNGEDCWLAMIQKTNMMPSTKRVSHRRSLLKGVAVYRVLYQSNINAKLTGRKNWLGKGAQATGMIASLKYKSSKADSKHLWELHKEWTEAGVSASRVPCSDVFRKRATKPLLNQRQRQKHLTWAVEKKELDCCSVVQCPLFRWK